MEDLFYDCGLKTYDPDFEGTSNLPRKKIKLMTPLLASVLDRTLTTDHNAAFIIAATAISLGFSLDEIVLSPSTIRRARIKFRTKLSSEIKDHLQVSPHLIAHFDGKILPDLIGKKKVDRIAIAVSGLETSHLVHLRSQMGRVLTKQKPLFTLLKIGTYKVM